MIQTNDLAAKAYVEGLVTQSGWTFTRPTDEDLGGFEAMLAKGDFCWLLENNFTMEHVADMLCARGDRKESL